MFSLLRTYRARLLMLCHLFCIVVATMTVSTASAQEADKVTPAIMIEVRTFEVAPNGIKQFLALERQILTPFMSAQSGFLGTHTLIDDDDSNVIKYVTRWRSAAHRMTIPEPALAKMEQQFDQAISETDNIRQVSCKTYRQAPTPSRAKLTPCVQESCMAALQRPHWQSAAKEITISRDPTYGKNKRYLAIKLTDYMEAAMDLKTIDVESATVMFMCSDGYRATMPLSRVLQADGWLAIRDLDAPQGRNWMRQARGNDVKMSPSYLVWPDESRDQSGLAWPYGLTRIRVVHEDEFHKVAFPDQAEHADGYYAFKAHCSTCHRINAAGGTLGPELNYPRNVTEYWRPEEVQAFIRNPQSFRQGSRMPAMNELSDETINAIVDYLAHMAKQKRLK